MNCILQKMALTLLLCRDEQGRWVGLAAAKKDTSQLWIDGVANGMG